MRTEGLKRRNVLILRLLSALICLCLLSGGFPAAFPAASEERAVEQQEDLLMRFGRDAQVSLDEAGNPQLVNGYPLREATVVYYDKGQLRNYDFAVDFLDYPFWRASTDYDGNLACMSLAMALSSSRSMYSEQTEETDPSENLKRFLSSAGFSDIRTDDYSKATSMYTVSTGMGSRRMEADGEEPFTLIAVGVCGGNYKNEWQSNMTPGNGDRHEGFDGASRLVVDRLAGYIATRGIKGRIKVWISGFSRAAAVTNLTAAIIADTGMFAREDIYAYTFATPAAVRNPPRTGYEHIFNIICPTDLVPQVMPADWGFGRYGADYFLAVPEFSSIVGQAMTALRAEQDETQFSVINNYSPELNFRTRILYSLLLDEIGDLKNYNRTFQPALLRVMQNKTIPSALATVRELMLDLQNSEGNQRERTDELMDYFIRLYNSSMVRSGLGATDRNTATALYRLFNEHNENSYLANMHAIRLGAFEACTDACYVMIHSPEELTITLSATDDTPLFSMNAKGEILTSEEFGTFDASESYYIERCGDTTILAVPRDLDYTLTWSAEQSGTLEWMTACVSVRASAVYPGFQSGPVQVRSGDTGVAYRQRNGRIESEGLEERSFDGRDLAEFAGIASLGINWRLALSIGCAVAGLIVAVILCVLCSRKPSRRKQYSFFCWLAFCLFAIGMLESEVAFWFFADQPLIRVLWKVLIAASLLFILFRVYPPRRPLWKSIFPGFLLALAADLVISFHTLAGMALFLACHLALIATFLRDRPMPRGKWLQWACVALPVTAIILFGFAREIGAAGWAAAVYAPVLLLMGFSSSGQPLRIRVGATFFVVSDLLLGLYAALLNHPMIHMTCLFLFYMALMLLAISNTGAKTEERSFSAAAPAEA